MTTVEREQFWMKASGGECMCEIEAMQYFRKCRTAFRLFVVVVIIIPFRVVDWCVGKRISRFLGRELAVHPMSVGTRIQAREEREPQVDNKEANPGWRDLRRHTGPHLNPQRGGDHG